MLHGNACAGGALATSIAPATKAAEVTSAHERPSARRALAVERFRLRFIDLRIQIPVSVTWYSGPIHRAKIIRRGDKSSPEVALPDPIHQNARRQGIFR